MDNKLPAQIMDAFRKEGMVGVKQVWKKHWWRAAFQRGQSQQVWGHVLQSAVKTQQFEEHEFEQPVEPYNTLVQWAVSRATVADIIHALHFAAEDNNTAVFNLAFPYTKKADFTSVANTAARHKSWDVVHLLSSRLHNNPCDTTLIYAAEAGNTAAVKLLLSTSARQYGRALTAACTSNHIAVAQLLCQHCKPSEQAYALHKALLSHAKECVELLCGEVSSEWLEYVGHRFKEQMNENHSPAYEVFANFLQRQRLTTATQEQTEIAPRPKRRM